MATKTLSALPWYGGKSGSHSATSGIGPWVNSLLPYDSKQIYCEPFAGMLGVLLQRQPCYLENVNDLDANVAAFWKTLRDQPDELLELLELTEYGVTVFVEALLVLRDVHATFLRKAWALTVVAHQSLRISGSWSSSSWRKPVGTLAIHNYGDFFKNKCYELTSHVMRDRLSRVTVSCETATDFIDKHCRHERCLMYLDPPYGNNYNSYAVNFSNEQAAYIVETITGEKSKAQIAVSGYPDCYFSELEKHGWERI